MPAKKPAAKKATKAAAKAPAKRPARRTPTKKATPAKKAPAKKPATGTTTTKAAKSSPSTPSPTDTPSPATGATETAVTAHIEALRKEQKFDTAAEVNAALAVNLAQLLDVGEPVTMTLSWARELRTILAALPHQEGAQGDPDPGAPAEDPPADGWVAGLSTPLRHTA